MTSGPDETISLTSEVVGFVLVAIALAGVAVGISTPIGHVIFDAESSGRTFGWLIAPVVATWLPVATWGGLGASRYRRWGVSVALSGLVLPGLLPVSIGSWERVAWAVLISVIYLALLWGVPTLLPSSRTMLGWVVVASLVFVVWISGLVRVFDDPVVAARFVAFVALTSVALVATASFSLLSPRTSDGDRRLRGTGIGLTALLAVTGIAAIVTRL